jgi:hypothetical protein
MWQDEDVGDLSPGARLLFIGLITMADDEGRLRELPAAILGHIFPSDNVSLTKLSRWLGDIERAGMIVRYTVEQKRYIALRRWTKHQKVDRPNASDLPAPPADLSSINRRSIHDPIVDQSRSLREGASGPVLSGPDPVEEQHDSRSEDDRAIFDYWAEQCRHPGAKPTKDRLAKIRSRRNEGYTVDEIHQAIDGAAKAAHVNDAGRRFDDIELICRNGSKLESFIGRAVPRAQGGNGTVSQPKRDYSEYDRAAGL